MEVRHQEAGWHDVNGGRIRSLPNGGQGDCLFRAISHQLEGTILAPALRQNAVEYMTQHLEDFAPQLLGLGWDMLESGEIPAGVYGEAVLPHVVLDVLRLQWTWGGAESIAALSRMLRRRIIVYQENGASIHFTPNQEEQENGPALRLLHRLGNDGRRTHYESVLRWLPEGEVPAVINAPPAENPVQAEVPSQSCAEQPLRRSTRHAQPPQHCAVPSQFLQQNFSDDEEISGQGPFTPWTRCKLCPKERLHRGRYALINCGLFPVCGACIRRLFIDNSNLCLHCGVQVTGWQKVFNQN